MLDRLLGGHDQGDREPVQTDRDKHGKSKEIALEKEKIDLDSLQVDVATKKENRKLRRVIAAGALTVMVLQIIAANAVFIWYGDTNGWDIPAVTISAWMGATVVEVVSVVLVIVNYLFPNQQREEKKGHS